MVLSVWDTAVNKTSNCSYPCEREEIDCKSNKSIHYMVCLMAIDATFKMQSVNGGRGSSPRVGCGLNFE